MAGKLDIDARVVLLDIEGTVCPISFVKDILFPYALSVLPDTLSRKWDAPDFQPYRDAFPAEYRSSPEAFQAHVADLMSQDLKVPYLKSLQGYLWLSGYESGQLSCPLFPDVLPALSAWTKAPKPIAVIIYSSGSVAAQKSLFQYTDAKPDADLRPLITDYFDTLNAGPKQEAPSYQKIASTHASLGSIGEWLFLSDNVKEVDAARDAGMQAAVVVREGNAPLTDGERDRNSVVESFEEIVIGG